MKNKLESRAYFMDMRAEQNENGSIITGTGHSSALYITATALWRASNT